MADTLSLEVATPERALVREQVSDVQVPGKEGYMGILPGHAPLLGLLGIGTLTYVSVADGKKRYLSIHEGFVEVLEDHVRVLADVAERAQEEGLNPALGVDPGAALLAMARAQARIATAELK
jgi:F-type H+-transporting ATPase subunit epsilon